MPLQKSAYAQNPFEGSTLDFMSAFLAATRQQLPNEICKTGDPVNVICNDGQIHYFVVFIDSDKILINTEFLTPEGKELTAKDCLANEITHPEKLFDEFPAGIKDAVLNPPAGKKAIVKTLEIKGAGSGPTIVPVRLRALCKARNPF